MKNWIKTLMVYVVVASIYAYGEAQKETRREAIKNGQFAWDSTTILSTVSPLASNAQRVDQDGFLPSVSEEERIAHPQNTEYQLRRAKWYKKYWLADDADSSQPHKHGDQEKERAIKYKLGITTMSADSMAAQKVAVLVDGTDYPIPTVGSGNLPVFSDSEKKAYEKEMIKADLDEPDFRRAAWWFAKNGRKPIPQMPEDVEMRKKEAEAKALKGNLTEDYDKYIAHYNAVHDPKPLTLNERLTLAGDILLRLNINATGKASTVASSNQDWKHRIGAIADKLTN